MLGQCALCVIVHCSREYSSESFPSSPHLLLFSCCDRCCCTRCSLAAVSPHDSALVVLLSSVIPYKVSAASGHAAPMGSHIRCFHHPTLQLFFFAIAFALHSLRLLHLFHFVLADVVDVSGGPLAPTASFIHMIQDLSQRNPIDIRVL